MNPMALGTRCHQLGMYVVFESPLQMLADSPSNYMREPEAMEFLGPVPTVWDETKVLDAKLGEYVLLARRSGRDWYVGAMTNWTGRDLDVDLSFLPYGNLHHGRIPGRHKRGSFCQRLRKDKDSGQQWQEIENHPRARWRLGRKDSPVASGSCRRHFETLRHA